MAVRLILPPGPVRYEAFQPLGHRYLVAIARNTEEPLRLRLSMRETIYPLEVRGRFATDDATLNAIHAICVRTQRVCALDGYVDTPWREQAQWWGDARVQAQNTFHLSGETRLLERGIDCLARQEVPNGLTFGHAPTIAYNCVLPDFSMIWALSLWDHYWQTGSATLFQRVLAAGPAAAGVFRRRGPRAQRAAAVRSALLALPGLGRHPQGRYAHAAVTCGTC